MKAPLSVIIVTYNSELFLPRAMEALLQQTLLPDEIFIVDTGSQNPDYLEPYRPHATILFDKKNAGFCSGNNLAYKHLSEKNSFVLLLNPDAFLEPHFIERAMMHMEEHPEAGAITGQMHGFDIKTQQKSGLFDSTGIFSTWYGKWYDRDQGKPLHANLQQQEPEAICGALFFLRKKALGNTPFIFDPSFYMYKEDIDLSLRIKKGGWKLLFFPDLVASHCRGWKADRKKMARIFRLASAKNELRVQWRKKQPFGLMYSSLKLFAVGLLDV